MNSETKIVAIIVSGLVIIFVSLTWICNHYDAQIYMEAMKNGYRKQTLPGQVGTHWVKSSASEKN